jgi:hypothetical protein
MDGGASQGDPEGQVGEPAAPSPLVFVAAYPCGPTGGRQLAFDTGVVESDKTVVLAFTSRTEFVAALGEFHPWALYPLDKLAELVEPHGAIVGINLQVPEDARRWTHDDLVFLARTGERRAS